MSTQTIRLNHPQAEIHRHLRPNRTLCLPWGRGVGKSWFIRLVWWLLVAEWDGKFRPGAPKPGVRIVLLMPTIEQAKKVHAKEMLDELAMDWAHLGATVNRNDWRITFPGGSWIQWVTAERAKQARGIRCDAVFVDEADDVPKEVLDAVVIPWFSEHHSLSILVVGGTPLRGRQGLLYQLHRLALDKTPGYFTRHATYRDAPETVDPKKVEQARLQLLPEVFKREWECDFDSAEGLVYPHFKESFHVRVPRPDVKFSEYIIGADHGYRDPNVFLLIGIQGSGRDAVCWVLDEIYKSGQLQQECIEDARAWRQQYPQARWFHDPSVPEKIESLRRNARIHITAANNDIEDGLVAVADRIQIRTGYDGAPAARLYVHPKCRNTIREFGLYRHRRDPRDRDRVTERVIDGNDHAMDALRYAIFTHFGKPPVYRNVSNLPLI